MNNDQGVLGLVSWVFGCCWRFTAREHLVSFLFFRMMGIVGRVDVLRLGEFSFDADTRRYAKYIFQFGVTWR